jgi:hypothetical protein
MAELRKVRAKEDIFSLLVSHFPPFPAKKSQNRHPREEKKSERKKY